MKVFRLILLCASLVSMPAFAQLGEAPLPQASAAQGPTLEETQRWIADKLHEIGWHQLQNDGWRGTRYEAYFDGCEFTLAKVRAFSQYHQYRREQDVQVDLVRWDANLAVLGLPEKASNYLVVAAPGGSIRKVASGSNAFAAVWNSDRATLAMFLAPKGASQRDGTEVKYFNGIMVSNDYALRFDTVDEVMQARLANAFNHAANLCRAQAVARRQEELSKSARKPGEAF